MTDIERLQQDLLTLFQDEFFLDVQNAKTELFEEGILDSLSFVRLLTALESRYGVDVPLDDLDAERFSTIEKIAAYVQRETAGPDPRNTVS